MLSILIPTYNYSVSNLLSSLDKVMCLIDFEYEILCLEDGSKLLIDENKKICNSTKNTTHLISEANKGSIASRNLLSQKAKYNWLLYLDADVELTDDTFIKKYSHYFSEEYDAIYGGCRYDTVKPNNEHILRWKYGKTYEQIDAKTRNNNPFKHIVSSNFLIKKEILLNVSSEIKNRAYGNDLLFAAIMKLKNAKVYHIDNFVIHKGLDTNLEFLNKSEEAINTLFKLNNYSKKTDSSLLQIFSNLKKLGLIKIIATVFSYSNKRIKNNLLSSNPSIKLFQFYKLGYLCSLSINKK